VQALEAQHRRTLAALATLTNQVRESRATVAGAEAVLDDLVRLRRDLHRHLHLENNILFPRAVALEAAYG
jgi:regulator of cell morphogenesis and NO signaling